MPTELRRPERTFTIRQLCLEFKCTPRALRFYEDKGLLSPARQGLNRVYSYKDRARLQLILRGASRNRMSYPRVLYRSPMRGVAWFTRITGPLWCASHSAVRT